MIKRNFPLIVLFLVFVGLLDLLWQIPRYKIPVKIEPEEKPVESGHSFTGRMDMPGVDDIYVLDNSAGRDVELLGKYIQGRAAGLHWIGESHFKKRGAEDIRLGVHLVIDSLGSFICKGILFSDADDDAFEKNLVDHIEYFWRYRKSDKGVTEFWIPLRWKAKFSRN